MKKDRQERTDRRRNIARALMLTYASLRTHLTDAVQSVKAPAARGNELWNARCVREYTEVMYALGVELESIAKIDFPDIYTDLLPK